MERLELKMKNTSPTAAPNTLESLDEIAQNSLYCDGPSFATIQYSFEIAKRHIKQGAAILEMGPAEGVMTDLLVKEYGNLTVVEGSKKFCEDLKKRYPTQLDVNDSLFETFEPKQNLMPSFSVM